MEGRRSSMSCPLYDIIANRASALQQYILQYATAFHLSYLLVDDEKTICSIEFPEKARLPGSSRGGSHQCDSRLLMIPRLNCE
jgi:hypothetical protein